MSALIVDTRATVAEHVGDDLEASFVYGSVAAGTAGPESDLDCVVLTRHQLDAERLTGLRAAFVTLQRRLGYQPDLKYPVEVFAVAEAEQALHEPLLLRALTTAGRGDHLDSMTLESDCLEVLRALLNTRVTVADSVILDSLTRLAAHRLDHAARLHHVDAELIAARIGVKAMPPLLRAS